MKTNVRFQVKPIFLSAYLPQTSPLCTLTWEIKLLLLCRLILWKSYLQSLTWIGLSSEQGSAIF